MWKVLSLQSTFEKSTFCPISFCQLFFCSFSVRKIRLFCVNAKKTKTGSSKCGKKFFIGKKKIGSTMTKSIQLSKNRNIDYLYIYFERNATLIICYFRFAAKSKKYLSIWNTAKSKTVTLRWQYMRVRVLLYVWVKKINGIIQRNERRYRRESWLSRKRQKRKIMSKQNRRLG